MSRLLRWLSPNTPLRGLVFGALLGFFVTLLILRVRWHMRLPWAFHDLPLSLVFGAIFALAWALIWGASGCTYRIFRPHRGTLVTGCTVAIGIVVSLCCLPSNDPRLWTAATAFTLVALIPCHLCYFFCRKLRHFTAARSGPPAVPPQ